LLRAKIRKSFDRFKLDAEFSDSGFICLTGANGSGKTTFLRAVAGALELNEGSLVELNGRDITNFPIERRNVTLVSFDSYIPNLAVKDHLVWGARRKDVMLAAEFVDSVREKLGIHYSGKLRELSQGMRVRVALATAILAQPELILVDEAFDTLDHREEFIASYHELAEQRKIDVIFATQRSDDLALANHHYVMDQGKTTRLF
jgi:ABC-type Fe3+/spermidine/putrescine transport system ATPase subunit